MSIPVLICDDSNLARKQMARTLPPFWDVDVTFAKDGAEGIDVIKAGKGSIVFLDLNMPVMDGLKLISLIRGEESLASMPICVITTEGAQEDRERAISLGANEYLTKPIQANKVLGVAKSLLKLGA